MDLTGYRAICRITPTDCMLLLGCVRIGRARKQPFPVAECDAGNVCGGLAVAGLPAVNVENGADLKVFLSPSLPDQLIPRTRLQRPVYGLPIGLDVDIDPGMGVGEFHLRDFSHQLD